MFKKGLVLAVLALFLSTPCFAVTPGQYQFIDLGILPGGTFSEAESINNNGQIVGNSHNVNGTTHATLFDATGAGNLIDLGAYTEAYSINNQGQIAGQSWISPYGYKATVFDPTGPELYLNTSDTGPLWALSISDNGHIVGEYRYITNINGTISSGWHAMLFDPTGAGNNQDLGTLGGTNSRAYAVNDNGLIVGEADNLAGYQRAVIFDSTGAGNNIDLGTLGGNTSWAWSVNNNGLIVGFSRYSSSLDRATLFDATGAGNNIDLGTLGGTSSVANSVNNNNQIVGFARTASGKTHATLFDVTGGGNNIDLNTLLPEGSGWTLTSASDINDNGWIVGTGRNAAGEQRAYLLKPVPEPATVSLLLLGGLAALRRKRK